VGVLTVCGLLRLCLQQVPPLAPQKFLLLLVETILLALMLGSRLHQPGLYSQLRLLQHY
jgi:hypothetical protein